MNDTEATQIEVDKQNTRDARIRQILKEIRASTGSVGKKTLIDEALLLLKKEAG